MFSIISINFIQSNDDRCIYIKHYSNNDVLYIGLYVDDMLIVSANQQMVNEFEEYFMSRFNCKPETTVNQFLGMKIEKNQNMIKLSNSKMVDKIVNKFSEFKLRSYQTPIEPNIEYLKPIDSSTILKDIPYREGVGSILYLSITCRNDIAFAVNVLSRFLDCPTKETWLLLLRCIGYLKYTRTNGITFGNLNKIHYNIPYVFCDSDWGGDVNTGRSTTCYIIIFNGGPISWCSRLQQTVSLSTTEAEYMALVATLCEIKWLQPLLNSLKVILPGPIHIFEDNQGAIDLAHNPSFHRRTKHVNIKYHVIREAVIIVKVPTAIIYPMMELRRYQDQLSLLRHN